MKLSLYPLLTRFFIRHFHRTMTLLINPRRPEKVHRYKPVDSANQGAGVGDDLMPDYMNILGMFCLGCFVSSRLLPNTCQTFPPLHRYDILHVWSHDEVEMVRLAGAVLFLH